MTPSGGITIVICCFNSADRIRETLVHIAHQKFKESMPVEIIVVNNASTDNTVEVVIETWEKILSPFPLKIVDESNPGLIFARQKGFSEARYEYICFIDDDNRIASDWVETVYAIMNSDSSIGALGGRTSPPHGIENISWFDSYKACYAVGKQFPESGYLNATKNQTLWGAGITIRKSAYEKILQAGYEPLLKGRLGNTLSAGEDSELCYVLWLAGYKLYYSEDLILQHEIPPDRINKDYLKNVIKGFGRASVYLDLWADACRGNTLSGSRLYWLKDVVKCSMRVTCLYVRIIFRYRSLESSMVGCYYQGRLSQRLMHRSKDRLTHLKKVTSIADALRS